MLDRKGYSITKAVIGCSNIADQSQILLILFYQPENSLYKQYKNC